MHDPRVLLDPGTDAARRLARRGFQLDLVALETLFSQRTAAIQAVDEARAEANRVTKEWGPPRNVVRMSAPRGSATPMRISVSWRGRSGGWRPSCSTRVGDQPGQR